mgnify:CR=1 FL=1
MKYKKPFAKNKSVLGIVITLFLVFFLGTSITVFSDSYTRSLEEDRKITYGSWHVAVYNADSNVSEALSEHASVDTVGTMQLAGLVMVEESNVVGGLGCISKPLQTIGNISLLDGRFPTANDEIAIEAASLNRLGYSLVLGQKVPISISRYDASGELLEPEICEFTLTGVIRNYTSNWKSNSHWLVSYCVSDSFVNSTYSKVHTFAKLDDTFSAYADSLQPLLLNKGFFVKNDYTYLQYAEIPSADLTGAILQTAILLSGCLTMIVLIHNELNRRQVSFVTMRILGATKLQIVLMFLKERLYAICLAGLTGILAGIAFPYLVVVCANGILEKPLYYQFSLRHILQISLLSFGGLVLALCLSIIRIFSTPLRGRVDQQITVNPSKKRKTKLNKRNIFEILDYSNRGKRWFSLALTVTSTILVLFSAYDAWSVYQDYSFFQCQYPEDYAFGMIASYYNPQGHLSEAELEVIKTTYGVKETYAFSASDYVNMLPPDSCDAEYIQTAKDCIPQSISDDFSAEIYATVIGVTDNLLPIYLEESDEAHTRLEDNEVILYVPDFYRTGGNIQLSDFSTNTRNVEYIIREDNIKAGTELIINTGETRKELTVAGVIHSFSPGLAISMRLVRPFSMICNEETYISLFEECKYTYALVYGDPSTIQYQTDVELSKIQTSLYFSNNRTFRSEKRLLFTVKSVLSLITLATSIALAVMIRYGIQSQSSLQERQKLNILYRLGMSKKTILKVHAKMALKESVIGGVVTLFIFAGYRCFQERDVLLSLSDYNESEIVPFATDVATRCLHQTSWLFVFVILFATMLINCGILMNNDRKYRFISYGS